MTRAYFDVPSDIVECATKLRAYFDERNIKDWALDGLGPLPRRTAIDAPSASMAAFESWVRARGGDVMKRTFSAGWDTPRTEYISSATREWYSAWCAAQKALCPKCRVSAWLDPHEPV